MTSFYTRFNSYDYRAICLFLACLIYAVLGSPTPDNIGFVEIIIGALLSLSIGIGRARDALLQPIKRRFWKSAGQVFLIYGLSVPVIVAVLSGNNIGAIFRDLLPFLFLFLPMFLLPLLRARPYYFRSTLFVILLIGILFSVRSLVMRLSGGCFIFCVDELLYLENMPTVLFTCLFLIGFAMHFVMQGLSVKNLSIFVCLISLSLIPLAAMILTLQRASIGAVMIYIFILQLYYLYKSPYRAGWLMFVGFVAVMVINISFISVFGSLWGKTQIVGLNMRPQEFATVWHIISSDILKFLFGIGWGGSFNSPAVGGLNVNFTHNFFSFLLLKMGALGIIFCIAYIAGLLERLVRIILRSPVFGLALAAPVIIDLTLYASFKSLDFGLMLLMISGSLVYLRKSESL